MYEDETLPKVLPLGAMSGVSPQEYCPALIREQEYPPHLRCPQFDAVFFFDEKDTRTAYRVISLIQKFVSIKYSGERSRPPDICTMDNSGQLSWMGSGFQRLKESLERTTYIFFLMTRNYDKDSEEFQKLRDEAMFEVLYADGKYESLIPLHTYAFIGKERFDSYPVAIRTPIGVNIRQLFEYAKSGRSIDEARPEDVDPVTVKSLQRIFDDRLGLRKKRERAQNEGRQKWLADELTRRRLIAERPHESEEDREERIRLSLATQAERQRSSSSDVRSPPADSATNININFIPQFTDLRLTTDAADNDTEYEVVEHDNQGILPRQTSSRSDVSESQAAQPETDPHGSTEAPYWL